MNFIVQQVMTTMDQIETSLTPMLSVRNGAAAIEFHKKAFGATEQGRVNAPDGSLIIAELKMGKARFFLSDESIDLGNVSPERHASTTVRLELTVPDPDKIVDQAQLLGAKLIFPVTDHDYGYRQGRIVDPFGHQWVIGRPILSNK